MAWIYFYLPEIKNRTLEEIDEMFEAKPPLPARRFRKYVCVGHLDAVTSDSKPVVADKKEKAEVDVVRTENVEAAAQ